MPKLPIAVLADPTACSAFCDVWQWVGDVLRADPQAAVDADS